MILFLKNEVHKTKYTHTIIVIYFTYLSINFRWNSFLRLSLMKVVSLLSGSALEQFLKTTSSSHLFLIFMSDLPWSEYFSFSRGLPERMFSILICSSSSRFLISFSASSLAFSALILLSSAIRMAVSSSESESESSLESTGSSASRFAMVTASGLLFFDGGGESRAFPSFLALSFCLSLSASLSLSSRSLLKSLCLTSSVVPWPLSLVFSLVWLGRSRLLYCLLMLLRSLSRVLVPPFAVSHVGLAAVVILTSLL